MCCRGVRLSHLHRMPRRDVSDRHGVHHGRGVHRLRGREVLPHCGVVGCRQLRVVRCWPLLYGHGAAPGQHVCHLRRWNLLFDRGILHCLPCLPTWALPNRHWDESLFDLLRRHLLHGHGAAPGQHVCHVLCGELLHGHVGQCVRLVCCWRLFHGRRYGRCKHVCQLSSRLLLHWHRDAGSGQRVCCLRRRDLLQWHRYNGCKRVRELPRWHVQAEPFFVLRLFNWVLLHWHRTGHQCHLYQMRSWKLQHRHRFHLLCPVRCWCVPNRHGTEHVCEMFSRVLLDRHRDAVFSQRVCDVLCRDLFHWRRNGGCKHVCELPCWHVRSYVHLVWRVQRWVLLDWHWDGSGQRVCEMCIGVLLHRHWSDCVHWVRRWDLLHWHRAHARQHVCHLRGRGLLHRDRGQLVHELSSWGVLHWNRNNPCKHLRVVLCWGLLSAPLEHVCIMSCWGLLHWHRDCSVQQVLHGQLLHRHWNELRRRVQRLCDWGICSTFCGGSRLSDLRFSHIPLVDARQCTRAHLLLLDSGVRTCFTCVRGQR